jgi:hypothetical protein
MHHGTAVQVTLLVNVGDWSVLLLGPTRAINSVTVCPDVDEQFAPVPLTPPNAVSH